MLEQLAVEIAEIIRDAEGGLVIVVFRQHHAEVVIAYIRREVIARNAIDTFTGFFVDDIRFQYLNQWQWIIAAFDINIHLDGNDLEFDGITITVGIVPMRQVIEAIVYHLQRIAQILLTAFSPG